MAKNDLTTNQGAPIADNTSSLTAGNRGPVLLQDVQLIEKLAHFDRERIPERVVHAKGAGALGFFECTKDMSRLCQAHVFGKKGRRTPALVRFSTVGGERGSADSERDPRGFAVKLYTEQGNYDLVGNNLPVFFIRDAMKFPDMVHTHKRDPATGLKDPDAFWDFFAHTPESTHMVTMLFSDRGTPASYRHMHGFGVHTFTWVNAAGAGVFVKYHFRTKAGVRSLGGAAAAALAGSDPDHATRDLHQHLKGGGTAEWEVSVQVMPMADADTYRYDPFDVTMVWRHADYPRVPIGRLVLDRNPTDVFTEIEQAAFAPGNLVPGVEPSPDRLLQGRLFSYPDTQRHRLGPNFALLPVNRPRAPVANHQRDGLMRIDGNGGGGPNYEPNSRGGPQPTGRRGFVFPVRGDADRGRLVARADDFEQAGMLFRLMPSAEQEALVGNLAGHLGKARPSVQQAIVAHFRQADADYGARVAAALGLGATGKPARRGSRR
jgi:catalase